MTTHDDGTTAAVESAALTARPVAAAAAADGPSDPPETSSVTADATTGVLQPAAVDENHRTSAVPADETPTGTAEVSAFRIN